MSDTTTAVARLGILGLIFITLKLTGHITWSWWWVLAPFWGAFALVAVLIGIVGFVYFTVVLWEQRQSGGGR